MLKHSLVHSAPPIKSLADYRATTGQKWKSRTSKKGKKQPEKNDVVIAIGLMQWSDEECRLKVKRGRRIALRASTTEQHNILMKSINKWKEFNSDAYQPSENYSLVLISG